MGFADEWFLHPLIPEWEREMVAEGMGVEKEEAMSYIDGDLVLSKFETMLND